MCAFSQRTLKLSVFRLTEPKQELERYLAVEGSPGWIQVYEIEGYKGEVAKIFDVYEIPKTILVSPEGTVVAANSQLKGTQLLKTLERNVRN